MTHAEDPRNTRAVLFKQLEDFMRHDVKNVLRMEHGGNYTAALLIAVGAEALSRIEDRSSDSVFIEMLTKHGVVDQHVAEDIVDALRHGVAHVFETKYIEVGKKRIELVVSWGKLSHLTTTVTDPPGLVLNVRTMWEDLQQALAEAARRLAAKPAWAEQAPKSWPKKWGKQASPKALLGWKKLFPCTAARRSWLRRYSP